MSYERHSFLSNRQDVDGAMVKMALEKKLEQELCRMWSESDTQMIMTVVDEELGKVAQKIKDEIKECESTIDDLLKDGSDQLDTVIKFYRGKIAAYKVVLGLLVEDSKEKREV